MSAFVPAQGNTDKADSSPKMFTSGSNTTRR
uniref:Uncharacterized protein n=1 Tax=Arundo donax TaxID=35708 RepID=A0A0A9G6P1_ARUDO